MQKILSIGALLCVGAVVLSGCNSVNSDRTSGAGANADELRDTTAVVVYLNADNVPNVAYFCAGAYGWAATLSNDGTSAPALVRFAEYDKNCTAPR